MTVLKTYLNNVYIINVFKYLSDSLIFSEVKSIENRKAKNSSRQTNIRYFISSTIETRLPSKQDLSNITTTTKLINS